MCGPYEPYPPWDDEEEKQPSTPPQHPLNLENVVFQVNLRHTIYTRELLLSHNQTFPLNHGLDYSQHAGTRVWELKINPLQQLPQPALLVFTFELEIAKNAVFYQSVDIREVYLLQYYFCYIKFIQSARIINSVKLQVLPAIRRTTSLESE